MISRTLAVVRELPEELVLPAGAVPETPPDPPAPTRDAASVLLVRDGERGLEVFLQRRVLGMAFAGGMTVFPGGGVDPRDADTSVEWSGPPPSWWAERFGCAEEVARALVCAAVRETFEESGVLLAGPSASEVVADAGAYFAERRALERRELSLAAFLAGARLVLRADLLRPWANWVTPVQEPRRYDTRFFTAALPEGQLADGVTSEASDAVWQRPADAIADWERGRRLLLPPTWVSLADLAELGSVAEVLSVEREVDRVIPKLVRDGDVVRVVLP
ncbi:NUDIX domain-containing protein [Actinosynnema pretiosum subsp. pretiosum]